MRKRSSSSSSSSFLLFFFLFLPPVLGGSPLGEQVQDSLCLSLRRRFQDRRHLNSIIDLRNWKVSGAGIVSIFLYKAWYLWKVKLTLYNRNIQSNVTNTARGFSSQFPLQKNILKAFVVLRLENTALIKPENTREFTVLSATCPSSLVNWQILSYGPPRALGKHPLGRRNKKWPLLCAGENSSMWTRLLWLLATGNGARRKKEKK